MPCIKDKHISYSNILYTGGTVPYKHHFGKICDLDRGPISNTSKADNLMCLFWEILEKSVSFSCFFFQKNSKKLSNNHLFFLWTYFLTIATLINIFKLIKKHCFLITYLLCLFFCIFFKIVQKIFGVFFGYFLILLKNNPKNDW